MRIAAISVAPLFPNSVFGGSQKILNDVADGLNRMGHDVQLWCTRTGKHTCQFEINGVSVDESTVSYLLNQIINQKINNF